MTLADNFAWAITAENGDLLAFQEKMGADKVPTVPEIVDKEAAEQRIKDMIVQEMENPANDYFLCLQRTSALLYNYFAMRGPVQLPSKKEENKSSILLPGKDF